MRVLVVGAGVQGCYYASRLRQAGADVTLLTKGEKLASLRDGGIKLIHQSTGNKRITAIRVVDAPQPEGYDLVIVSVLLIQIPRVMAVLKEMQTTNKFLFLGVNIDGFEKIALDLGGQQRVMAGFGTMGGAWEGDSVVYSDLESSGRSALGRITCGELNSHVSAELKQLKTVFAQSGIRLAITHRIEDALKTQTAFLVPVVGSMYLFNAKPRELSRNSEALLLIIKAIKECIKVFHIHGVAIRPFKYKIFGYAPNFVLLGRLKRFLESPYVLIGIAGQGPMTRKNYRKAALCLVRLAEQTDIPIPTLLRLVKKI